MQEPEMNRILSDAIDAHGGFERWRSVAAIGVESDSGGELLNRKVVQSLGPLWIVAETGVQECRIAPVGSNDRNVFSSATRTVMETGEGDVPAERTDPRADRQRVVSGKRVSVPVHLAGPRPPHKTTNT